MSAIRFSHLDHCSVLITDLAKARAFYVGVLGLTEIPKPKTFDFVALWFDLGDGQTLHLLQKPQPDTRSPRHFALRVPDAKQAREHFRGAASRSRRRGRSRTATASSSTTPTATASSSSSGSSRTTREKRGRAARRVTACALLYFLTLIRTPIRVRVMAQSIARTSIVPLELGRAVRNVRNLSAHRAFA